MKARSRDLLKADQLHEFQDQIAQYFDSLPRNYVVFIPVPTVKWWVGTYVTLTDRLSLTLQQPPRLVKADEDENPKFQNYLAVNTAGFGTSRLDSTAVASAISYVKHFLGLSKRSSVFPHTGVALPSAVDTVALVKDVKTRSIARVRLPEALAKALARVRLK